MSSTDIGGSGETGPSAGGGSPKEMAHSAAQTVKQEAASFAEDARHKAVDKVEEHKQTASRTLGDFAGAVRRAGQELEQSDQSMGARLVRQAADGLEGFARSVADKRPEELIDAVRDFGRRNPTAFIAGSVLAGVALGRFFRSSKTTHEAHDDLGAPARFQASDGGPPEFGLADPEAVGATSIGTVEAAARTEGLTTLEDPENAGAAGGPPEGAGDEPGAQRNPLGS